MSVRVQALANKEYSYSAKRMDGSSVDELNWGFRWYILNQSTDEEYGTLLDPTNTSFVTVIWKAPTLENANDIRILVCEVLVKDENGNETCQQTVRIEVVVTTNVTDLGLTIGAPDGYTTAYTGYTATVNDGLSVIGPVRLIDQCHIQGTDLVFYAQGSTGVTLFNWQLAHSSATNYGYFVDGEGNNRGSFVEEDADGLHQSETILRIIGPPPSPPANGSYYVRVQGLDDNDNSSGVGYIKFKVVPENPYITPNFSDSEVVYVEGAMVEDYENIYFNWTLHNIHHYPEWFKMRAYLELGEIISPYVLGLTTTDYTGIYWNSGTMLNILDDYIYNLKPQATVDNKFIFGHTVPIPGFFGTGWGIGDPDEYKVCLRVEFQDEDYGATSCVVEKDLECQVVRVSACPIPPPALNVTLVGPTCPTGVQPGGTLTFTRLEGTIIPGPSGCTMGMIDDGTGGCTCPSGQILGYTNGATMCVPTGDCPTGTIRVGDFCIACVEPTEYGTFTGPTCTSYYCVEVFPAPISLPCWSWTWEWEDFGIYKYWKYVTELGGITYYRYTNIELPFVVVAPDEVYYSPQSQKLLDTSGVRPLPVDSVTIGSNTYDKSQFSAVVGPM